MKLRGIYLTAIAALFATAFGAGVRVRQDDGNNSGSAGDNSSSTPADRAAVVKDAFLFAWNGYYTNAFPNDELHPVSNKSSNSRNGWGASAVDALSTAIIMDQQSVVSQILDYIPTIDFTQTPVKADSAYVSLFETTIRYMGGMLASYDLLQGPFAHLVAANDTRVAALLSQAQSLANSLSYAFESQTGIPSNNLLLNKRQTDGSSTNGLATAGSLILEWQRLSDLTGNATYGDLARKAEQYLINAQYGNTNYLPPGLQGSSIDINTGVFVNQLGGWGAESDSYYEYLIKMFVYDQSRYSAYAQEWTRAANSSIQLASHPIPRPELTYLPFWNGNTTLNYSQHLACFSGGNFILGGTVLGLQKFTDFGLDLVAGCRNTYVSTKTGIGPEIFSWDLNGLPSGQHDFFNQSGFWIASPVYNMRPEVLESYYYAWRVTKDPKYQEWAWEAIQNILGACLAESGFSAISDDNANGGGSQMDFMESFTFAELFKYAYMIFADDAEWQVGGPGQNNFVFNTEAHPVKVVGKPL